MKAIKTWFWRLVGLAGIPALTWFALYEGSEGATNALPFIVWLYVVVSAFVGGGAAHAITEGKLTSFKDIAERGLSPKWWVSLDNMLTLAAFAAMLTHAWYVTALGTLILLGLTYIVREDLRNGVEKYRKSIEPKPEPPEWAKPMVDAVANMNKAFTTR